MFQKDLVYIRDRGFITLKWMPKLKKYLGDTIADSGVISLLMGHSAIKELEIDVLISKAAEEDLGVETVYDEEEYERKYSENPRMEIGQAEAKTLKKRGRKPYYYWEFIYNGKVYRAPRLSMPGVVAEDNIAIEFQTGIVLLDENTSLRFEGNPVDFDVEKAGAIAERLRNEIDAPYVNVQVSTLGGRERVSILMVLSLDDSSTWVNRILQNSRYMHFSIRRNGVVEQFSKGHLIDKKFRKRTIKSVEELIYKINEYLDSIR